jgi:hypothetical protein
MRGLPSAGGALRRRPEGRRRALPSVSLEVGQRPVHPQNSSFGGPLGTAWRSSTQQGAGPRTCAHARRRPSSRGSTGTSSCSKAGSTRGFIVRYREPTAAGGRCRPPVTLSTPCPRASRHAGCLFPSPGDALARPQVRGAAGGLLDSVHRRERRSAGRCAAVSCSGEGEHAIVGPFSGLPRRASPARRPCPLKPAAATFRSSPSYIREHKPYAHGPFPASTPLPGDGNFSRGEGARIVRIPADHSPRSSWVRARGGVDPP